jgi:invasion protein IalB
MPMTRCQSRRYFFSSAGRRSLLVSALVGFFVLDAGLLSANAQSSGAWKRECIGTAGSSGEQCFIRQRVVVKGKMTMTGSFGFAGAKKGATVSIQLPLGTALKAGIRVGVDDGEVTRHRFDYCTRSGCTINVPLTDKLLSALKAGSKLNVGWATAQGKPVGLRFDLVGFTGAWDSLRR